MDTGRESEMTSKRLWGVLATALAAVAVLATQLPAAAHHKEGHNQGKPEPRPTASPTPTPTQSPSPPSGPGVGALGSCFGASLVIAWGQARCNAVSEGGTIDIVGWSVSETDYDCRDIFHWSCNGVPYRSPQIHVTIDTGSGPALVCSVGEQVEPVNRCQGSVQVASGTPYTCAVELTESASYYPRPRVSLVGLACS